jgi:WD40 repeat protein
VLWNTKSQDLLAEPVVLRENGHRISLEQFSPNNRWLITSCGDRTIRLWDLTSQNLLAAPVILRGHDTPIGAVVISPDSRWLIGTSRENGNQLWALEDIEARDPAAECVVLPKDREASDDDIGAILSSKSRWLVTGVGSKTVRLWDLSAKNPAVQAIVVQGNKMQIKRVTISPDDRWAIIGIGSDNPQLWGLGTQNQTAQSARLDCHRDAVTNVGFSPGSCWLVTASADSIRLWDLKAPNPTAESAVLNGDPGMINDIAFSPDDRWLAIRSDDRGARLWDLKGINPEVNPTVLRGHDGNITAMAFSSDQRWLATGGDDNTVCLWDLNAHSLASQFIIQDVQNVAFSPDSRWLIRVSYTTLHLWDLRAQSPTVPPLALPTGGPFSLQWEFSSDSRWLFLQGGPSPGSTSPPMARVERRLWDLDAPSGHAEEISLPRLEAFSNPQAAFSLDSRWLAIKGDASSIHLFDLKAQHSPSGPLKMQGNLIALSLDSCWLATVDTDTTVLLWDASWD